MGRKENKNEEKKEEKVEEEEEDTPVVKELKVLSSEHLEKAKELEQKVWELRQKFAEENKCIFEKRKAILTAGDGLDRTGTPACKGFWYEALHNNSSLDEFISDHDKPVLEYMEDLIVEEKNATTVKFRFLFAENPYFEQKELSIEVFYEENLYNGEFEVQKTISDSITWKPDKDVTVEKTQKKVKGGGAKKAKQKAKSTIEPRDSFFRRFLCSYTMGEDLPQQVAEIPEIDEEDSELVVNSLLESIAEAMHELRTYIVPFAVRWYTGEAVPEDYDDDEDEEEESEDDDDDSDDEEETPKGKKSPKKGGKDKKAAPGGEGAAKQEECKQQ